MGSLRKITQLIILIAILVGLVYVFPHLIYLNTTEHYNPLAFFPGSAAGDESLYAAGVMEVLEGNIFPSDLAVYEHKGGPSFYGPLPFIVMAGVVKIVGSMRNTLIFSDFIFSALVFVLFYYLSNIFLKNKHLSLVASLVMIFFYRLFIPPASLSLSGLWNHLSFNLIFKGGAPVHLWFARFVHPQVSTIFFFLTIICVYWALKKNKLPYYLLAGVLFALNFYSYFFFWTYLLVFLGLLLIFLIYKKAKSRIKGISITLGTGLLLAIPYFVNLFTIRSFDLSSRSGIELGRFIETISFVYLFIFVLFFVFLRKKQFSFYFLSLLFLPAVIVLNIQLLLGFTVQNNHWNSRVIVPILIILLFYVFQEVFYKLKYKYKWTNPSKILKKYFIVFIIVIFLLAVNLQVQEVNSLKTNFNFSGDEYELVKWIGDNVISEEVILTSSLTWNLWIPAYTSANVYFPYAASTLSSNEEITERFIFTFNLLNKSEEEVNNLLYANSKFTRLNDPNKEIDHSFDSYLKSYVFLDRIYPIEHTGLTKYPVYNSSLVSQLASEYAHYKFNSADIEKYRVNYILLVGEEQSVLNTFILDSSMGAIVFKNDAFLLFKLN
jgi:hypothetical protein